MAMATVNPHIRITAAVRFDTDASTGGKILKQTLKQQSDIDTRRLSRLSLIAALGAGQLKEQCKIHSDCAVFLGTPFSSPSVFEKMADNVLNHHAAMPFDFIANLHNSPVFHAAQALGTHGATLVVAADNNMDTCFHPLLLAMQSLQNGGQAAVGWVYEHQAAHADTHEGSIWILLEVGVEQGVPVELNNEGMQPERPSEKPQYYWQDIADWIEKVMACEGRDVKKCTL
ncbi:hypothetical protein HMPREF2551_02705 [Neisseria sp. HMSC066H01]|uniref:hypothetical protein n=1 Tax=Neisseria sp. HMSC066H01 TaxID=1715031 RepID=UPI0008A95B4C|nr:hypothetical protein [Neisseria sp. HMSC066H01]OHQ28583.1 hypothetical protein HMPREF2551_02705 [Neisseria sp. HMSC066H01]